MINLNVILFFLFCIKRKTINEVNVILKKKINIRNFDFQYM